VQPVVVAPVHDYGSDADGYADEEYDDDDGPRRSGGIRRAFWKGVFVGAAVVLVIGIAYVVIHDNTSTTSPTVAKKSVTTTLAPTTTLPPTTTTTVNPGRPPQQVRVQVVNASGATNAATNKAAQLTALGYPNAGLADGTLRKGTAVQCKPGFDAEAITLAKNVGGGAVVEAFPTPAPAGSTNADCVVVLGQ
jgi:hypothetical protein